MTDQSSPMIECAGCGQALPADATRCPHCGMPARTDQLTPLGGTPPPPPPPPSHPQRWSAEQERERLYRTDPVERAPGQDAPGSWGYVRYVARQDPLFAVVLALLALNVLVALSSGSISSAIISAAVFWGVYTFQNWGFWLAMIGAGLGLALAALSLTAQPAVATFWGGIFLFAIIVLYLRREYFG